MSLISWIERKGISRKEQGRIFRFAITGTVSTALHYGVYLLLLLWINPSLAYTGGYLAGFILNYFLTTYFTFQSKAGLGNMAGFSVSHVVNYLLELGILNLLIWAGLSKSIAGLVTLVVVVPVNFLILRTVYLWREIFKKAKAGEEKNDAASLQ